MPARRPGYDGRTPQEARLAQALHLGTRHRARAGVALTAIGELKPVLTALALPPALPLLLVLLGVLLLAATRRRRAGIALSLAGAASLWLLSCHGFALLLAQAMLPSIPPAVQPAQVAQAQAIVVLGGGVRAHAPEFGTAQPSQWTLGRLRYGAWLAHKTGKPLAFAGGVGWAAVGHAPPEAQAAAAALADWGVQLRWNDARSRDTAENAREMKRLLARDGVTRIALVTDAWHMPRSVLEFERAGFTVVPAPTHLPAPAGRPLLEWLPSADGLTLSRAVLREALGLVVARVAQLFR